MKLPRATLATSSWAGGKCSSQYLRCTRVPHYWLVSQSIRVFRRIEAEFTPSQSIIGAYCPDVLLRSPTLVLIGVSARAEWPQFLGDRTRSLEQGHASNGRADEGETRPPYCRRLWVRARRLTTRARSVAQVSNATGGGGRMERGMEDGRQRTSMLNAAGLRLLQRCALSSKIHKVHRPPSRGRWSPMLDGEAVRLV